MWFAERRAKGEASQADEAGRQLSGGLVGRIPAEQLPVHEAWSLADYRKVEPIARGVVEGGPSELG